MAEITKTISGWNPWKQVRTKINGVEKKDAPLPPLYSPASAFWVQSLISNCNISWLVPMDPFSAFLLGGGATFSLLGSTTGLAVVGQLQEIPSSGDFGWGLQYRGPEMGFCINSLFKQHLYVRFRVVNNVGNGTILVLNSQIELLQNYRSKRIYVHCGSVVNYSKVGDEHLLTLDVKQDNPPPSDATLNGSRISILNSAEGDSPSSSVIVNILGIKDNWDLIISDPGDVIIKPNAFYMLSDPWCVSDPYLLSGFWRSTENTLADGENTSGYNLFVTSHTKPYVEGSFTGVYIWTNTESGEIATVVPKTPFKASVSDEGSFDWAFYSFDSDTETTRYQEYPTNEEAGVDEQVQSDALAAVGGGDYLQVLSSENISFVRVELSDCGDVSRHNFYYDLLTGQYIYVGGKYFKILGQITKNILDVSKVSVDGTTVFDPFSKKSYSILNHMGWFITEHYDGNDLASSTGVFRGNISVVAFDPSGFTNVVLHVGKDSSISWRIDTSVTDPNLTENNFIYRYRETYNGTNVKKMYEKYQGWKLVIVNNSEYDILDLSFENPPSSYEQSLEGYDIKLKVSGDLSSFDKSGAYISFGETYDTYGSFSKESGYSLDISYVNAANNPPPLIVSDQICMDGNYISNPYLLNIPLNARVSVCGGYLFGLETNNSAISNSDFLMLITVPTGGRGIASLFHTLRHEGWAVYIDPNTNRMTVRRGSLDYKEYPIKSEVAIGKYESVVAGGGGNVVNLDATKERLRRLSFLVPEGLNGDYLMFGIGNIDNIHGFVVLGDGVVNLQAFNKLGVTFDSSEFKTTEGQIVSPVYVYKQSDDNYTSQVEVDIAADILNEENKIYLINGTVEDVTAQYIKNSQTIEDPGFFDVMRLSDGEVLVIYGQEMSSFNIKDKLINPKQWTTSKGVMALGTFNDDFYWGTPLRKGFNDDSSLGGWQYPIMLMNNVEYYSSIYNPLNETIMVFVRAIHNGKAYVGALIVPIIRFLDSVSLSTPVKDSPNSPFLWRDPLIEADFLNNYDKSWLDSNSKIDSGYTYDAFKSGGIKDEYIRVLGPVNCQVTSAQELEYIFTTIMPDGTYLMIYDSAVGIKMAFSTNSGRTWSGCNVVVSADGRGGVMIGKYLFYITAEGIAVKYTDWSDIYQLRGVLGEKQEGNSLSEGEIDIQKRYDKMEQDLIGSGVINFQRLSGYVTPEGIIKVFYYGNKNELICMDSSNARNWNVSDNF